MKKVVSLAALGLFAASIAQEGMMMQGPPPEVKRLEFLVGEFTGTLTMFEPGAGGGGEEAKSTAKATMGIGGRYLVSHESFTMGGMEFSGLFLATYDETKKKYMAWWFDQMSAGPLKMEGGFEGDKLVLVSEPTEMPGMGMSTFRATYSRPSDADFQFLLEIKVGDSWSKMMEGKYKKK